MGDGISLAIGSLRFQVGKLGTLRMPDQPTAPAIALASWFPPPIGTLSELNTSAIAGSTDNDSSRGSDLGDLATEDGAYGSGSESCGSNSFPNHFMRDVINAGDTSVNRENTDTGSGTRRPNGSTPNGTGPPNGSTPNSGPTNGGNGALVNNEMGGEPSLLVNGNTAEHMLINLNDNEWARCREALRGNPLPPNTPQNMLMGYHWLLKVEFKRHQQVIAQLEARRKAADESSLRRAGLSSHGGSSSKGNEYVANKRRSRLAHLTEQEHVEAAKVLDFSSMMVDTRATCSQNAASCGDGGHHVPPQQPASSWGSASYHAPIYDRGPGANRGRTRQRTNTRVEEKQGSRKVLLVLLK